jgi:hypothetical protein
VGAWTSDRDLERLLDGLPAQMVDSI